MTRLNIDYLKSPFEFLLNLTLKVMNSDEQFWEKIRKSVIIELLKKNVKWLLADLERVKGIEYLAMLVKSILPEEVVCLF